MKRAVLLTVGIAIAGAVGVAAIGWHGFTRERLHRTFVSADGKRSVAFFKQRVPPYVEGVSITAEYRRADGTVLRQAVVVEDWWTDFDGYSQHQWADSNALTLGSPGSFARRPTGSLELENQSGRSVGILSMDAGGQIFIVLDLAPGEARTLRFPLNTSLEWISARFTLDGTEVYCGTNFTTRCSEDKESEFVVRLLPTEIRIENQDFGVWKTWPNKSVDPNSG